MDGMPFGLAGTRRVPASEAFLPPPHPHMRQTITIGPLAKSSMAVFRSHLRTKEDGLIDASAIHSKACFNEWVATREGLQKHPEKTFQRTLTATLSGSDGRIPFTPQEEAAILEVLRAKRVWPCFADLPSVTIGAKGYRSFGYHERIKLAPHAGEPPAVTRKRRRAATQAQRAAPGAAPDDSGAPPRPSTAPGLLPVPPAYSLTPPQLPPPQPSMLLSPAYPFLPTPFYAMPPSMQPPSGPPS